MIQRRQATAAGTKYSKPGYGNLAEPCGVCLTFQSQNLQLSPQQNLGYEKYASAFEDAKIGLLELPYLPEERLEQLGVPMGPRMRILQEAKTAIGNDHSMNVYIL